MKSTVSSFAKRHDCSLCNTIKALDNYFFFPQDKNREFKEQMWIQGHFSNPTFFSSSVSLAMLFYFEWRDFCPTPLCISSLGILFSHTFM